MKTQHPLNLFQRSCSFCLAAVITFSLLGGIDQLAQQPQAADGWALHTSTRSQG